MSRLRVAMAAIVAGALLVACTPARASDREPVPVPVPVPVKTVHLTAHHSHWSASHLTVPAATRIRIIVRNDDPIDHEFIIGDQGVQDRHERGTEARHPPRPGEISVPAGSTVETTVWFPAPTTLLYGCHLPGHWDYGMHGTVTVT